MSDVTIYHHPACGTARNTLALIRHAGIEPHVIEYLETPPSKDELRRIAAAIGLPIRGFLRRKGTPYDDLRLDDPAWTDDELLEFMTAQPILINRPIVATPLGTALCRPSEAVLNVLPVPLPAPFVKEDGKVVVDERNR